MPPSVAPPAPSPARVNTGLAANTVLCYALAQLTGMPATGLVLLVLLATLVVLVDHTRPGPSRQPRTLPVRALAAGLSATALATVALSGASTPDVVVALPALALATVLSRAGRRDTA